MGIEIQTWRSVIGIFYGKIQALKARHIKQIKIWSTEFFGKLLRIFKTSAYVLYNTIRFLFLSTVNLEFLVVLLLLVLMSGDVSENPGPDLESISTVTGDTCSLSILHLNIRSIRNKIKYIEENFNDFDILCFTETH